MIKPVDKVIDNAAIFGCVMVAGFVQTAVRRGYSELTGDKSNKKV